MMLQKVQKQVTAVEITTAIQPRIRRLSSDFSLGLFYLAKIISSSNNQSRAKTDQSHTQNAEDDTDCIYQTHFFVQKGHTDSDKDDVDECATVMTKFPFFCPVST